MRAGASEAARTIISADEASGDEGPKPPGLRLQWNVPLGVTPSIPLWLAGLFFGLLAVAVLLGVAARLTEAGVCETALDWREAASHEGDSATFTGVATPVGSASAGDVSLEVGDGLLVVIPEGEVGRFGEDVREGYSGRPVAVTGQVEWNGQARIIVTRPENLVRCD